MRRGERALLAGLDSRCFLLALVVLTGCVVSHGKYDLLALLPYLGFPLLVAWAGGSGRLVGRLVWIVPLAALVGAANPWLDRTPRVVLPGVVVAGGWVSFGGILVRALVLAGSALAVAGLAHPSRLLGAARRLGLPRALEAVLFFLGRYLGLLMQEGARIRRARLARAGRTAGWRSAGGAVGALFLRAMDRSERIHWAMLARGYAGDLPRGPAGRFGPEEWAFLALTAGGALGWRLLSPGLLPAAEAMP